MFSLASWLEPLDPDAWYQLALAIGDDNVEFSRTCLEQAIQLDGGHVHALTVLGGLENLEGNFALSKKYLDRALAIAPKMPTAHWNRSTTNLALGNWEEGFADYEYGVCCDRRKVRHPGSQWEGGGKRLLIWGEQGFGDIIMFSRFVPFIKGPTTILEVRKELFRLFQAQKLSDEVSCQPVDWSTHAEFDSHISLLSLPYALGPSVVESAAPKSYIKAPGLLDIGAQGKLKVGLVWTGSKITPHHAKRSVPFEELGPLFETKASFYSLQKPCDESHPKMTDIGSHLGDFADTADAISGLDLVISTDTAVCHLAGAMGKPVWTMIPFAADWRWGIGKETSDLYPSMRLFRQERPGDWSGVIERIAKEL